MALCAAVVLTATACSAPSQPAISLDRSDPAHPAVVVTGLSRRDVRTIERAQYGQAEWTSILRVSVVTFAVMPAAVPKSAVGIFITPRLLFDSSRYSLPSFL